MSEDKRPWADQFWIHSKVDLDFVIGQKLGYPVGMLRSSPPEFRRRVAAAAISYQLQLRSIDYAMKRYVDADQFDEEEPTLGDAVSDYLSQAVATLIRELRNLHTEGDIGFGVLGAEITLYRLPFAIDIARMLSNRGLLLEVLPILRLCFEMTAWSNVAFRLGDEDEVVSLKAQSCVGDLKRVYGSSGRIYGYLSKFAHWGHVVHGQFLNISSEQTAVLYASVRYRAMSLALCLVIVDVLVEVVRNLYGDRGGALILGVHGIPDRTPARKTHRLVSQIAEVTELEEVLEIKTLLDG